MGGKTRLCAVRWNTLPETNRKRRACLLACITCVTERQRCRKVQKVPSVSIPKWTSVSSLHSSDNIGGNKVQYCKAVSVFQVWHGHACMHTWTHANCNNWAHRKIPRGPTIYFLRLCMKPVNGCSGKERHFLLWYFIATCPCAYK